MQKFLIYSLCALCNIFVQNIWSCEFLDKYLFCANNIAQFLIQQWSLVGKIYSLSILIFLLKIYVNVNFFLCNNCYHSNIIDNVCANIVCTVSDQAMHSLFHSFYFLSIIFLVKVNVLVKFFYLCKTSNCTSSDQALHPLSLVVIAALAQITKDKR